MMNHQHYYSSQRQLSTGTSMIQYLKSLEASDILSLTRGCLYVAALVLLWGQSAYAVGCSGLAFFIVYGASSVPAQWLALSGISTAASFGSWLLLSMAPNAPSEIGAGQLWLWGTIVEKLSGAVLLYVLYSDVTDTEDVVAVKDDASKQQLEIRINILAGRNLVPKDKNLFGRKTSSDPYVVLYHGSNRMGKTSIIYKTLNPVWDHELCRLPVLPEAIEYCKQVELHVFDHDHMSEDDPMGTVYVNIPEQQNLKVTRWYPVENGEGEDYCKNASGELYLTIEVRKSLITPSQVQKSQRLSKRRSSPKKAK